MPNLIVFTLTVRGEERHRIKELFDQSAVPTEWGCHWAIPGYDEALCCDKTRGDGITETSDSIVIQGECAGEAPVGLALLLSRAHPTLLFEIEGADISNDTTERWWCENGITGLVDCIAWSSSDDDNDRLYCQDGIQFLPLPVWINVSNKSQGNPFAMIPDWIPQRANVRRRLIEPFTAATQENKNMTHLPVDLFKGLSEVFPRLDLSLSGIAEEYHYELWKFKAGRETLVERRPHYPGSKKMRYVKSESLRAPLQHDDHTATSSADAAIDGPRPRESSVQGGTEIEDEDARFLKELEDM